MKNKFIYAANWKAYLSFNQAQEFIMQNKDALKTLGRNYSLVICPSFDALATVGQNLQDTQIALGAQDCSAHQAGAYTGQVLAESLKQIGCAYSIIGHSEVKAEHHETIATIAQKAIELLNHGITPIICTGETTKDYETDRGTQALEEQLTPIFNAISKKERNGYQFSIAYEPLWAIGSGNIPAPAYLKQQIMVIRQLAAQIAPQYNCMVLYGGGVDEVTIGTFNKFPDLDGVLIGKASTDFQTLQKIVLS